MTMNRGYKATLGLALLVGAGIVGIAGAQGMMGGGQGFHGMHGGGMGMVQGCTMMGESGGMQGMMGGGPGGMGMHGGMMSGGGMGKGMYGGMGMMGGIDLDEGQHAQLRERRSAHRHEQFSRMAKMMDLREEMHALMHSERPDPDAVRELHGRMADLHGEMMAERIRMRNDVRGMLTDEQRERLRAPRQGERGMRGEPGMHGGEGHRGQYREHHRSQSE